MECIPNIGMLGALTLNKQAFVGGSNALFGAERITLRKA
jgi:hypothetical protein